MPLPAREGETPLPHHRVVAVGQGLDETVGLRRPGGGPDLLGGGPGRAEGDVVGDRGGEEEGVLEHDAHRAAQLGQPEPAHVDAVEGHPPAVGVVEPGEEQGDGGLPRTAGPDEGDPFAGLDLQAEAVEQRRAPSRL